MVQKSLRISVKPHNRPYIEKIAAQMEINDYSEVINYLLLELKRLGYSFNSQMPVMCQAKEDIPYTNQFDAVSIPSDSLPTPSEQIDPIIQRLVSLGLCEQNF